ncbi:MAG: Ig-like domain-containing protein [Breznakibacter sp.]
MSTLYISRRLAILTSLLLYVVTVFSSGWENATIYKESYPGHASLFRPNIPALAINPFPAIANTTISGTEDQTVIFTQTDFTNAFPDLTGPLDKVMILSLPANGSLNLSGVPTAQNAEIVLADLDNITFVPDANWNGSTSFSCKGSDGTGYSDTPADISISIAAVNDLPTLSNITKNGNEDEALTFSDTDFLSAFTDVDGSLAKIKITSLPGNGTLKVSGNPISVNGEITTGTLGNLVFEPSANWNGSTSFDWNGYDGESYAATDAKVNISITAVNDVPTVSAFSLNGTEDVVLHFTKANFTGSFSDVESALTKVEITTLPANGTLKLSGTGIAANAEIDVNDLDQLTFEPSANWNGSTSFQWNGYDGTSYAAATATVTLSFAAVNDTPTFTSSPVTSATQNVQYSYDISATDVEGGTLTITAVTKPSWLTFSTLGNGLARLEGTPLQAQVGTHNVTLRVSDGNTSSDQSFIITVANVNDAPVFTSTPVINATEDVIYTYNITTSDLDGTIPNITVDVKPTWLAFTDNDNGTATLTGTPTNDHIGVHQVTLRVSDELSSATQSFEITVINVNDAPVINSQKTLSTDEDVPVTINLSDLNVTDVDNTYPTGFTLTVGTGSNYTVSGTTVTPSLNFVGTLTVPVQVNDGQSVNSTSAWYNLQITVNAVNDAPTLSGFETTALTYTENAAAVNISSAITVADVDNTTLAGATITIGGFVNGEDLLTFTNTASITGTWNNSTGIMTLSGITTLANYNTALRNVKYQNTSENPTVSARQLIVSVNDGTISSAQASRTLVVQAVNDTPVAPSFTVSTKENVVKTIDIGAYITDAENNVAWNTLSITQNPAHGSVNVNTSSHTITYTPVQGYSGSDSFAYQICDSQSACASGIITVSISNEAPEPQDDTASTNEDTPVIINVLQNDTDPQNNLLPSTLTIVAQPTKGTVQILADHTVRYSPDTNIYGDDSFEYEICDATDYCSRAKVNITINAVNDSPSINDDVATTSEDVPVLIDVLANDNDTSDPLGGIDASTLTVSSAPLHGTAAVESGKIRYMPNTNYFGSDSFSYTVKDKGYPLPAISGSAQVSVTINAVNDAPVITGQQPLSTDEDVPIAITLANLTVTDVDNTYPQGFTLTVLSGTNYTVAANTVTPSANYYGTLTVPARVNDGSAQNANSEVYNLTITVNPVNDSPIATDDMVYTGENTPINFGVTGNDSDPYDPQGGIDAASLTITRFPKNGSAVILPNNNINYTPFLGFFGKDTIEYRIADLGYPLPAKTASAKIYIEVFRLSPEANNDVATTAEDIPVEINLLANDTDSGNDINPSSVAIITAPAKGTLSTPSGGKVTYTPSLNYHGTDFFTYTVKDYTNLTSNVARVDITITPVNDAPVAQSSSLNTRENMSVTILFASVMSDVDENINLQSVVVTQYPTNGSLTVDKANNEFIYQPAAGFTGTDQFRFRVSDSNNAQSNEGTITIVVSNQAPKANPDEFATNEDTPLIMNVAQNDTDPQNNIDPLSVSIVTMPKNGTASVNSTNGYVRYVPNTNYHGRDSLEYRICDTDGYCDVAKVKITINPVNDAPVANNDAFELYEDTNGTFDVLQNDTDPENNIDAGSVTIVSNPLYGTLEVNPATGMVTYKPMHDFNGQDSFSYKVCDTQSACSNTATVLLTVIPVNDAPDARADIVKCYSGIPTALSLWTNDVDVDNNLLPSSITITTFPLHGTATVASSGVVTYTAAADYTGPDTFEYQICDTDGECDKAWVTLTIYSGNLAPTPEADHATTNEDEPVRIYPLSNDTDPNDNLDPSTFKIVVQPVHGSVDLDVSSSSVIYTPFADFYGDDYFVYEICDNDFNMVLCASGTVFITVVPVNDAPVASDDYFTGFDNMENQYNVLANDFDVDGDVLSATLAGPSSYPDIDVQLSPTGILTVTPALGVYCRQITLSYNVCDAQGSCGAATIYIDIEPSDSDGDGIPDAVEGLTLDSDNDSTPDYLDTDSDNDGISDRMESGMENICNDTPIDSDNDGTPDYLDTDSDNDGVPDKTEGFDDCDNDGVPNYRDYFDDCENRLKVPETFSPNGDGINDFWVIPVIADYPENQLTVYNRWGTEVYHKTNYDNSWDGRSSVSTLGKDILPEGTYFYVLKLGKGEATLKGTVYIKR